ncbi:MAG TPA: transglutaminase-like domain-containing protein [Candidatus Hydrogenedentes bacterium]|nr:transglutaminase-like domain-containing protein [Candidatus Hydrogenedentota bacterium]HPG65225.1 transglutaminase-like domain-containing protein [Candidatus Hydrogenedentota bacterium]
MDWELDPNRCLEPTEFMDFRHEVVVSCVDRLDLAGLKPKERAVRAFNFVRDQVPYEFFAKVNRYEYVASHILKIKKGFCVQKAMLLATLGRAAGIPSALVVADLRDYTMPQRLVCALGSNVLESHAVTAFHLDGRWVLACPALSPDVVERRGLRLVEFTGEEDALLHSTTASGERHAEYARWRGIHADLPFDMIVSDYRKVYDHIVAKVQQET